MSVASGVTTDISAQYLKDQALDASKGLVLDAAGNVVADAVVPEIATGVAQDGIFGQVGGDLATSGIDISTDATTDGILSDTATSATGDAVLDSSSQGLFGETGIPTQDATGVVPADSATEPSFFADKGNQAMINLGLKGGQLWMQNDNLKKTRDQQNRMIALQEQTNQRNVDADNRRQALNF